MSLKHRKGLTWLVGLSGSLFLALGAGSLELYLTDTEQTTEEATSWTMEVTESESETEIAGLGEDGMYAPLGENEVLSEKAKIWTEVVKEWPDESEALTEEEETWSDESEDWTKVGWADEPDTASEELYEKSPAPVIAAAVFLALGFFCAFAFVLGFKQALPLLGPEADLILVYVCLALYGGSMTELRFIRILVQWVLGFGVLAGLRGVISWIRKGLPISWSTVHRLGLALSERGAASGRYLFFQAGWCMAAGVGACLFWGFGQGIAGGIIPGMICAFSVLLAGICLWRVAGDVDHLARQASVLHEGRIEPVRDGIFKETEEQLADLLKMRDEAVRTAVTSERFKVDLISNVSHDLRTPLTAILGYGELLQKEEMSESGKEQLTKLNQKAGYMRDLVESLFELTKVSSGVLESKKEEIDLIRLLEQTLGLYDDQLKAADLEVRRHYDTERLPIVTDGMRMHQVFANLVGNALKYTLKGTRIHLEVKNEVEKCIVRLINIASYEMDFEPEEILQRFARGDKSRSTQGSGLGLAIAQTYTESVGGSFEVHVDGEQFSAVVTLPKNSDL